LLKPRNSLFCNTAALALLGAVTASAFTGADTYKAKCAMCHGPDGSGSTPVGKRLNVRDLRSADVQAQSTDAITAIITNGQKSMPAFGKSLNADQIKDLVGYIRSIAAK
jgi:cytochrome c6